MVSNSDKRPEYLLVEQFSAARRHRTRSPDSTPIGRHPSSIVVDQAPLRAAFPACSCRRPSALSKEGKQWLNFQLSNPTRRGCSTREMAIRSIGSAAAIPTGSQRCYCTAVQARDAPQVSAGSSIRPSSGQSCSISGAAAAAFRSRASRVRISQTILRTILLPISRGFGRCSASKAGSSSRCRGEPRSP